ncbi:MAG: ribosomal RNA small subunit methyltransferase A [Ruminococcaceae bacterium]|nr:ribosomal RNA small subunit methyltransferase A [Oscillospiraceae bacterium]
MPTPVPKSLDRQATRELMQRHNIRPTHSLGQNFLVEERYLAEIIAAAELSPHDLVLEIGPGLGHLTRQLAAAAGQVVAIEIDRHLLPALAETTSACENVNIIHDNALKVDFGEIEPDWQGQRKVVANLPYYITTPLIIKLLTEWPFAERIILTIQNETAGRILAQPGQGEYGPLAVLCQLFGTVRKQRVIPADAFLPRPNIDSCLLVMTGSQLRPADNQWCDLSRFLQASFQNRRKKLRNVLNGMNMSDGRITVERIDTAFTELEINGNSRAEELTPVKWYALYLALLS